YVREPDENSAPRQVQTTVAHVAAGGIVTTSVLGDWIDPDGDPLFLASATTPVPDSVTYTPEGLVVFRDGGAESSPRTVTLTVSDGSLEAVGTLTVEVAPA